MLAFVAYKAKWAISGSKPYRIIRFTLSATLIRIVVVDCASLAYGQAGRTNGWPVPANPEVAGHIFASIGGDRRERAVRYVIRQSPLP